jgi:hypothetical protein
VPAKKSAKPSKKAPAKKPQPKAASKARNPDDPALSAILARQEHLSERFDDFVGESRKIHPDDPALSTLLGRFELIEEKLDRILAAMDKNGVKAPVKGSGQLAILPPAVEMADASRLQPADADTAQFLSRTPLFAKLSAQECSMLAVYLELKTLPKASPLFQQGDFGDAMYIVKTGALEIYKNDVFGSVRVAEVRPGGLVGEMALVENKPRSANVRASEDSKLLVLSRSAYADLKKVHPQVATKFQDELLLLLSGRLRQTTEKLVGNK